MARHALLIASNGAVGLSERLRYAVSDAANLADALRQPHSNFHVEVIADTSDANKVRHQVLLLADQCDGSDDLLIYFAGHGIIQDSQLFLVLDGTATESPIKTLMTALKADDLLNALNLSRAQNKLLILDCCNAGTIARRMLGSRDGAGAKKVEKIRLGSKQEQVLMASGFLEKARELEALEGGFLSVKLREALTTQFENVDRDRRGFITLADVMRWLDNEAARHNAKSSERVPRPSLFGSGQGEFVLANSPMDDWTPYEINWPDGSRLVVLPALSRDRRFAMAIGKWPVTNAQYRRYVRATSLPDPVGWGHDGDRDRTWHDGFEPWNRKLFSDDKAPVVCVSYADAARYCMWATNYNPGLHATGDMYEVPRVLVNEGSGIKEDEHYQPEMYGVYEPIYFCLPDLAIWHLAAFGTEFPDYKPEAVLAEQDVVHHSASSPLPIGARERINRRGVGDAIGNVWEWCDEFPDPNQYYDLYAHRSDPLKPQSALIVGGSFNENLTEVKSMVHASQLDYKAEARNFDVGFRLAAQIPITCLPQSVVQTLQSVPLLQRPFVRRGGD